jgi:chemotaxis protein methyltransferase CheR
MNSVKSGSEMSVMELTHSNFERVRDLLYSYCGISLHEGKSALVRARLIKRIRRLGMGGFSEYLEYIESEDSGSEFLSFIDVLTTNKTSFFRESQHFDYMLEHVIPKINGREVKWWSAGCSSGEEPLTMAMTANEVLGSRAEENIKILATDLSRDVLNLAQNGVYSPEKLTGIPPAALRKYFERADGYSFKAKSSMLSMITYGRLNLLESWPMKGPFHLIMCRNVMIYFDRPTQQRLVSRFRELLEPGGYLFIGHSESVSGNNSGFRNLCPAVYQKT